MILESMIQGSTDWHEYRKKHIMASDSCAIMNVSKWTTPYQLFCEKTGLSSGPEVNDAMRKGLEIEPIARSEVEAILGMSLPACVLQSTICDWMGASLDGYNQEKGIVLEIKLSNSDDHFSAKNGKIPEHYYPQLQHQMLVSNVESMYYYSYREGDSILLEVKYDDEYCSRLLAAETDFWRRLQECDPPDLTDKDFVRRDDADWFNLANHALVLQRNKKLVEEAIETNREQLERMAEGKSCIGGGIKFSRITKKGNVKYKAIPELLGVDLEKYRAAPTTYYRISEE